MGELLKLKKKYKFILIEDCCQAHLAKYKNKTVGSIGDAGCFSFYATKNMTTGEGGAVLTNNLKTDALTKKIINHGRMSHYGHDMLGYNFRLTNVAAAMGLAQCEQIQKWTKQRIVNAKKLSDGLKNIDFIETPFVPKGYTHVYHQYTVKIPNRDEVHKMLCEAGIGAMLYYPIPLHFQKVNAWLGMGKGSLPVTEANTECVISLPMFPELTKEEQETVASTLISLVEKSKSAVGV
jgi:dTDP-4-amino-4,6-dideoxygalactose transaminase